MCGVGVCFVLRAVLDDENATAAEIRQFDQRRVAMAEIRQSD